MKTNHTSFLKYSAVVILFACVSVSADDAPPPYTPPNSTVANGPIHLNPRVHEDQSVNDLQNGVRSAGGATGGSNAIGGGAPDQSMWSGLAANAASAGFTARGWETEKVYNPNSTNPIRPGGFRGVFDAADEYLNSLPRTPGTTEPAPNRTTGQMPPAGRCGQISDLTFAGVNFIGDALCVAASNDTQGSQACAGGYRYVNPANPQYGLNISGGTRTENPLGYYYCVPDDSRNTKQNMCEVLAPLRFPGMEFRYVETPGGRDGNCTCAVGRTPTSSDMCNNAEQIASQSSRAANVACQGNPNVEQGQAIQAAQIPGRTPATYSDGLYCRCSQSAPQAARGTYVRAPVTPESCGAGASAQAAGGQVVDEFNRCLERYRETAMACESQATQARNTCREKIRSAQDSPLNIAGSMVGAMGQVGMARNAGSGNQQNCFGAGVGMMGVREALRMGRETCEAEYGTCQRTCAEENYNRMLTECPSKLRDPATNQPLTQAQLIQRGGENAQTFENTRGEIQRLFTEGRRICTTEAGGANQDMSRLMSGLGNSIQQSMQCACNLSSANSGTNANCNQIPTIQSCETNPNLPNCQIYGGVDTCNPTSVGYNQQMCNCMQNPGSCTTVSGTPPPSMFGGNLRNAPAGSGPNGFAGNLAGGAGGGGRGGYDLGSDGGGGDQAMLARPEFAGGASGGAGGGAGGGMGGGGAGGAGGTAADGTAKVEVQEKGLAGLFNQAKTALAGALGLGKGGAPGKTSVAGKPAGKEDLTKFKPRGLASAGRNGIGSANMDIFGMIKMCAQGETCETNRPKSAWILTP